MKNIGEDLINECAGHKKNSSKGKTCEPQPSKKIQEKSPRGKDAGQRVWCGGGKNEGTKNSRVAQGKKPLPPSKSKQKIYGPRRGSRNEEKNREEKSVHTKRAAKNRPCEGSAKQGEQKNDQAG